MPAAYLGSVGLRCVHVWLVLYVHMTQLQLVARHSYSNDKVGLCKSYINTFLGWYSIESTVYSDESPGGYSTESRVDSIESPLHPQKT